MSGEGISNMKVKLSLFDDDIISHLECKLKNKCVEPVACMVEWYLSAFYFSIRLKAPSYSFDGSYSSWCVMKQESISQTPTVGNWQFHFIHFSNFKLS